MKKRLIMTLFALLAFATGSSQATEPQKPEERKPDFGELMERLRSRPSTPADREAAQRWIDAEIARIRAARENKQSDQNAETMDAFKVARIRLDRRGLPCAEMQQMVQYVLDWEVTCTLPGGGEAVYAISVVSSDIKRLR